jgi:hypothetical protein
MRLLELVTVTLIAGSLFGVGRAAMHKSTNLAFAQTVSSTASAAAWVTPEMKGGIGNGLVDDTKAIQAAFNSGHPVRCDTGHTFLVSKSGTSGNLLLSPVPYALTAPAGLYFDGTGCVIKVAVAPTSADVPVAIVPSGSDSVATSNITLINVTLDQQGQSQPIGANNWRPAILFSNTPSLQITNLTVNDAFGYCGDFVKAEAPKFRNLRCNGSLGQGWAFGAGDNDGAFLLTHADARDLFTVAVLGSAWPTTLAGNPATFYVRDSFFQRLTSSNDAAGWKMEGSSRRNIFSDLYYDGGSNGTNNSGFKVQADSTGDPADNTIIGLEVRNTVGPGFYETGARNTTLVGYAGIGNATGGAFPEIWIAGTNTQVHDWSMSNSAAKNLILLRSSAISPVIGFGTIVDPATPGAIGVLAESSAPGAYVAGGTITDLQAHIKYYVREDSVATGFANYFGRWLGPPPTNSNREMIELKSGDYTSKFGPIQQEDPTHGSVTLASGATDTFVHNRSAYYVGELSPHIIIVPINASARKLGVPRYTVVNGIGPPSGFGIHLLTPAAAGTEVYEWMIDSWYAANGGRN